MLFVVTLCGVKVAIVAGESPMRVWQYVKQTYGEQATILKVWPKG